jgi:hypothetical protein
MTPSKTALTFSDASPAGQMELNITVHISVQRVKRSYVTSNVHHKMKM